ncbi:SpaA isopeptide-forming pilin-related protein [Nocardioides sp. AN3]
MRTFIMALVSGLLVAAGLSLGASPAHAAGTATLSVTIAPATTPILSGATAQWVVNYQCSSVDPSVTTCDNAQIKIDITKLSPQGNPVTCMVGGSTGNGDFNPTTTGFIGSGAGNSIPVGASGQLTFACKTAFGTTPDQSTLVATATFSSDSATGSVTKTSAPIVITAVPGVSVDKALLGDSVLDGVTAYQITGDYIKAIKSNGDWDTKNPVLVDTLPAGAVFVSASNGGVYDAATNTITWPSSAWSNNSIGPDISAIVHVTYPSSTFGPTDTVTNKVKLTTTTVTDPHDITATDSVSHTFSNATGGSGSFRKTVSNNDIAARAIFKTDEYHWNLTITNTGTVPIGGTLYDYPPCQSAPLNNSLPQSCTDPGFKISRISNVPQGSVLTLYLADGTTQTVTKSTDASVTYAVPAAWSISGYAIKLPDGTVDPTTTYYVYVYGNLTAGNAYVPMTQTNCAQWSMTNAAPTTLTNLGDKDKSCAVAYFKNAAANLQIRKAYTGGPDALISGQVAPWSLVVSNQGATSDPHYVDAPVHVTDTLPAGVTYVPGSAVVTNAAGAYTYDADYTTAGMTVTQSGQTLTFTFPSSAVLDKQHAFTITFKTIVNAGVGVTTQTNTASVWNDADPTWVPSAGGGSISSASFTTGTSAQAGAQKMVEGQYDSQYLFSVAGSPAVGQSPAGGISHWKLSIGSLGSTTIDDLVVYDVFPYVGDTGVSGGQSGVSRGSQFQPTLAGPITTPAGVTATYSLSTNPCRPEVYPSQPVGCDPTWLTAGQVTDWSKVRAVRIDATTKTYQPGQTEQVTYDMKLPVGADPGDIAWNSLAYTAAGPNGPLLPAEPVKVGIKVVAPPSVDIEKADAAGNDADTAADAVTLDPTATTQLKLTVKNNGGEPLKNVKVSDQVTVGSASVTGLTCTFPDGSTGTQWAGPLAVDASFGCTATLSALGSGAQHADDATVDAVGTLSGTSVTDDDEYHGKTPAKVDVYLRKVGADASGSLTALDGSQWTLQRDANGAPGTTIAGGVQPVAGQTGEFEMAGLLPGTYWLTEASAPGGYVLLAQPISFTIAADGTVTLGSGTGRSVTLGHTSDGDPEITVQDAHALALPFAGGSGSTAYSLAGAALLALAGLAFVLLRRRSSRSPGSGRRMRT